MNIALDDGGGCVRFDLYDTFMAMLLHQNAFSLVQNWTALYLADDPFVADAKVLLGLRH
ncbi:hypothetical protein AB1J06_23905 [Agrobacterium tumefaciens]|jgi:hypothetical protein|uniref:hypothetical protein n=1 Tax=Agrobacterium tumefaciens TaxID=358 RepID=UPI0013014360